MVMESATLSNPLRKFNVAPVQKSLSLPSYARAGGEGIDHRLIFAALEQKEKVRRKSKIFTREKTARQNIFCLPISTGSKCRETSLSSDTSCSSLEYQKPKLAIKPKKEDSKPKLKSIENDPPAYENSTAKTNLSSYELKTDKEKQSDSKPYSSHNSLIRNITNGGSLKLNEHSKGHRSPVDTLRLNVGSSDSMERSSRSSNDSLSRKERLVAIKARVEAEREKYGISSSDEEFKSGLTRYNSDGGIHRTVREVKSRSYRNEKRLRRRSQGEWAIRKIDRKDNLSLCLNPEDDSIKLHLEKLNHLNDEINHLEVKTDFCPSPNVLDATKKNYFSDFPSRENVTKFVQQRIRHIEEVEKKRRSGSDFFDKIKCPPSCSSLYQEKTASIEHLNQSEKKMTLNNCVSDIRCSSSELSIRASPIQRVAQAPTPPPRSPKSITFVNKAFLQHQNAASSCQENGADKKNFFHPNISAVTQTRSSDKCVSKKDAIARHSEKSAQLESNPAERQRLRELFNSRRKTCGNFDFIDEKVLNDLCSSLATVSSSNLATSSNYSSSLTQIKNIDNKSYPSSAEVSPLTAKSDKSKSSLSKWEENERKREFMFNSLESKKNSNSHSWAEWKVPLEKSQACFCNSDPDNRKTCDCKYRELVKKSMYANSSNSKLNQFGEIRNSTLMETKMHEKWGNSTSSLINEDTENKSTFSSKLSDKKYLSSNVMNGSQNNLPFPKFFNQCENKTTSIECNSSLNNQSKDNSVTANLDSAMAELENVYLSLKLSSDNLSDRNSLSNISLSDEEASVFNKVHNNLPAYKNSLYKRSSIHEINSPFNCLNGFNFEKSDSKNLLPSNQKNSSNPIEMNYGEENSKKDTLFKDPSFNELFSDLMPQLNSLEEKLKSHDHRYSQTNNNPQTVKSDQEPCYSPSSIRLKKEFYENLHIEQNNHQRKKVAIQKLTKNLSNLMNSPDNKTVSQNLSRNNTQRTNLSVNNLQSGCPQATILNPYRTESKLEPPVFPSRLGSRTDDANKPVTPKLEEIRHIRVSMDCASTQKPIDSLPEASKYPRLSSAVQSPLASPKCDGNKTFQFTSRSNSKENVDKAIDGLEELLNSLIVDVNESKQSSLPKTKVSTTTTISTGYEENVNRKRYLLPSKMDMCFTSKSKTEVTSKDPGLIKIHSDEKAQKENTAFRHNNNAHLTHTSFIPVYTKKPNVCHYFSDKGDENNSSPTHHGDQDKLIKSSNSLVSRQKYLADQNEKVSFRSVRTHIRRRSVGFEDMTSLNSGYFSKEKRNEAVIKNSVVSTASDNACGKALNSDNESSYAQELTNHKENISCISGYNQNSEVLKNANDQIPDCGKPYQLYKDKSSKRKSSLNRMDFIGFSASHAGNSFGRKSYQSKGSSSDEEIDSKPKQNSEFLTINSKRKHVSPGAESASNSFPTTSSDIPCQHSIHVNRMKLLPKSLNSPHFKPKQHRKSPLAKMQIQKLSHSAGELETLTDETTGTNKVCLSAQEFDICDSLSVCARLKTQTGSQFKYHSQLPPVISFYSKNSNHQDASQTKDFQHFKTYSNPTENLAVKNNEAILSHQYNCNSIENIGEEKNCGLNTLMRDEPILSCMNLNDSFELKHIDSKSEDDLDGSTTKMHNLKITDEKGIENFDKVTDDNCDSVGSDGERRPSSILRKKYFEERKELHGILKPPPDDKMSVAPPSILKHRESSEEKDVWQQPDLHSILKKSTSEDESCNSGSDIRPILKVSTDEESPGGSSRPRPILKKRTSFSEECSYASYPNGELKPILKKKTLPLLASDDQPRPILKSRRKSEDAHSTLSEIIASRPRAYSADMGVKSSHENRSDGLEQNKEFSKIENHDL